MCVLVQHVGVVVVFIGMGTTEIYTFGLDGELPLWILHDISGVGEHGRASWCAAGSCVDLRGWDGMGWDGMGWDERGREHI